MTFFRRVWRWHFWAGLLCAPVLVVTALTGGVYVFKDEIESAGRPQLAFVDPDGERKPIDDAIAAAQAVYPGERPLRGTVYSEADRATVIQLEKTPGRRPEIRLVFVNPYSAAVLGDETYNNRTGFFPVVLRLHQKMYAGDFGRAVVELVTSWSIVLVVSGVYLWWPRKLSTVLGVWLPRFRAPPYTVLRDLHSLPGVAASAIIVLLAGTGLFFTQFWGKGYSALVGKPGAYPFDLTSPPDRPSAAGPSVPLETVVREARARWPESKLMLEFDNNPAAPFAATIGHPAGDKVFGYVAVDRTTGEVVADRRAADVPLLSQIRLWVYPIHVGSVYGTTTKVLAVSGCLVLVFAAISGVAMWFVRKPKGRWGFPAAVPDAKVPVPAAVTILLLGVILPTVGGTLLIVLAGEWAWTRWTRP